MEGAPGWWAVITSTIQQAQRLTTEASVTMLAAGRAATAHVGAAGNTGVLVESVLQGCIVQEVTGGGRRQTPRGQFSLWMTRYR